MLGRLTATLQKTGSTPTGPPQGPRSNALGRLSPLKPSHIWERAAALLNHASNLALGPVVALNMR
jgi:hypothetical protein